ncbi:hypothetical protein AMK16_01485 [Streptomyces sp. CB00455]|uniref:STAS domain-containing protein n=1 Tax=Streptomyces sp. CB00455 TaxID=1703927 RepID=UPI00093D5E86|nr:STAS domain-containing protein [Streptomyces sp. CB00455]OKK21946.1 hypothetical protein AMK16_01485 [Streptomyces sp. CB00455]
MFSVDIRPAGPACVVALRGELDFESVVQLQEAAESVLTAPSRPVLAVIDCTELDFCDSSGIGSLVRIYQRQSAHGGELRLAAVPGSVARVLTLTGLDQAIGVYATLQDALTVDGGTRGGGSQGAGSADGEKAER